MKSKHDFDMVTGTQEVFRLLLDAIANPGRPVNLSGLIRQFAADGKWLAPALTLLDNECSFYWDGDPDLGEEIRFLSGASRETLEKADFVFISSSGAIILPSLKAGTHRDPHDSAMLFIDAGGTPQTPLALKGPGVPPDGRKLMLSKEEAAWVKAREEQNYEYPCGIEMIFLRDDCSLIAITRKVAVTWLM